MNLLNYVAVNALSGAGLSRAMRPAQLVSESSLGTKMILAVAASYLIDGILLAGFAVAGTISSTIPLAYTAIGLIDSSIVLLLRAWSLKKRRDTSNFALAEAIAASSIQLAFAALVPQMAFYFFTVLFIVFGCASLGLSKKQSALAWISVAVAAALVMSSIDARISDPSRHSPGARPGLVMLCSHAGPMHIAGGTRPGAAASAA